MMMPVLEWMSRSPLEDGLGLEGVWPLVSERKWPPEPGLPLLQW